jgi:type IX secretion system PorP/SprF family membrane protein
MKRYIRMGVMVLVCAFAAQRSGAQDIHFSQFYENSILRNPALTGIFSGDYKVGVNYRNQWSSISVPFQTGLASAECRIPISEETGDNFSFGVTLSYDQAGSLNFRSFQCYPAINYNKALEDRRRSYISGGFAVGYIQRSFDPGKMRTAMQYSGGFYDPNNPSGENITRATMGFMDVGAGMSFNSSMGANNNVNYYFGAGAYHVNKPRVAFDRGDAFVRYNVKWSGNLGFSCAVNERISIAVHANYSRQGASQEIIGGFLAGWKKVHVDIKKRFTLFGGVFYRANDAIIPTVKLDYNMYSFTASYDINNSTLKTATQNFGGYEFSLFYRGALTKGPWAKSKLLCPRFEDMPMPIESE